jgi:hypothetical protein
MAMDEIGGAAAGVASGAKIGAAFGPVGMAVGAVLGGIAGLFGGSKKRKARKYAAKVEAEEARMVERAQAVQRRDLIRQMRIARAQALAAGSSESGGLMSSGVQGAVSSIGSQGKFNLGYFDTQIANQQLRNNYARRAGKYASQASNIFGVLDAGVQLAESGLFSSLRKPPAATPPPSRSFKGFGEDFYINAGFGK